MKNAGQKKILETIRNEISSEKRKQNDVNLNLGTGASSWLTTFLIKEEWYILNKQSFWALLSVRYNRRLKRVPSHCALGNTFNLQYALRHLKVGLVILRHNYIRNTTAKLLTEVCKDVRVETQLQPLSGGTFSKKTASKFDRAKVDVSSRGFWLTSQIAFFDIRVSNPAAKRYVNLQVCKSYKVNEKEKKEAI